MGVIGSTSTVCLTITGLGSLGLRTCFRSVKARIQQETLFGETKELLLDKSEIRQLILNLSSNAIESMINGGTLTIRTYRDNENDILQVEDQGAGMDEQLVKKLGIPFVTTKDNRVGLGLAMVYNIAKRHNAKIEVATRQTGTIVKVIFKGDKSQ